MLSPVFPRRIAGLAFLAFCLLAGSGDAQIWRGHEPYRQTAPYAGPINYAHAAPTFRWGWFGAEHFYPSIKWHRGYNGEHYRWSRQRRY